MIKHKNFESHHPFNFECVNVVYFLKLCKQYQPKLNAFELERYKRAKKNSLVQNPGVYKQYHVFVKCVNIMNFCIKQWNLLFEEDINYGHKEDPHLEMLTLIDVDAVRNSTISMEIIWFCTENSPMRYMIKNMEELLPKFMRHLLVVMNCVINFCAVKGVRGSDLRLGLCDLFNISRTARLKKRLFERLCKFLHAYKEFELRCLAELFKLSTKFWMMRVESESEVESGDKDTTPTPNTD